MPQCTRHKWASTSITAIAIVIVGLLVTAGTTSGQTLKASSATNLPSQGSTNPANASLVSGAVLATVSPVISCSDLLNANLMDLPGAPTELSSATLVTTGTPKPYCDVTGYVASDVQFELRLPVQGWSQRFVMAGCGGYCGFINLSLQAANGCPSVQAGDLAIASTDLGHESAATNKFADAMWAVDNPSAVVDFAYLGMHKVTLASKALIQQFYGQQPQYSYFDGCSDGGREALQEAQRYPTDYDGILAGAPVIDEVTTNSFYHAWNFRVNTGPDGHPILTADKIPALHQAVLNACGKLDYGVGDMVQDSRACHFDAKTMTCKSGVNNSSCLTPDQAKVADELWQGPVDNEGQHLSAGDMPYGSELAWVGSMVPKSPDAVFNGRTSSDFLFSAYFPKYLSSFNSPTDITNLNLKFDKAEFELVNQLHGLYDPTDPDLRAFAAHGGKLLLWQGWADSGASPRMLLNYYDAMRTTMGATAVSAFVTLYMIPGEYHCAGGPTPVQQDFLTPLIQWREQGVHPHRVVISYEASATDPTVVKTRPVFPYPNVARYTGHGSINDAANFVESPPTQRFSDRYVWLGLDHYQPGQQIWCDQHGTSLVCRKGSK